jgi:hypothetical protein
MNTVITNFRTDEVNYGLLRRFAADSGVSINKYLNRLVSEDLRSRPLGMKLKKRIEKDFYDAMLEFADQTYKNKPMSLSTLDAELYE